MPWRFYETLSPALREDLAAADPNGPVWRPLRERILEEINEALESPGLYDETLWANSGTERRSFGPAG